MKFIHCTYVILIAIFVHRIWFGKNTLPELWQLQEKIAVQQLVNQKLEQRNEAFRVEIRDLKEGLEAIEEHARYDFGFIKPNEVFYRVIDTSE